MAVTWVWGRLDSLNGKNASFFDSENIHSDTATRTVKKQLDFPWMTLPPTAFCYFVREKKTN